MGNKLSKNLICDDIWVWLQFCVFFFAANRSCKAGKRLLTHGFWGFSTVEMPTLGKHEKSSQQSKEMGQNLVNTW